jgi:ATP-binding cassette subfamily C protein
MGRILRMGGVGRGAVCTLGSFAAGLLESVSIASIVPVIQSVQDSGASSPIAAKLAELLSWFGLRPTLGSLLGFAVAAFALRSLIIVGKTRLAARGKAHIGRTLRHDIAEALFNSEWTFLNSVPVSRITNAIAKEADRAGNIYWQSFLFLGALVTGLFYCAMGLASLDGDWVVISIAIAIMFLLLFGFRGFGARAGRIGARFVHLHRELQRHAQEHFSAAKSIKSLGADAYSMAKLDDVSARFERNDVSSKTNKIAARTALEFSATAFLALIIFASLQWLHMDIAQAVLMIVILNRLMPIGTQIQQSLVSIGEVMAAAAEAFSLLERAREHTESVSNEAQAPFTRALELRSVYFTHAGREHHAVAGVTLRLETGKIVALVGPSGVGKTTLADMVMGLLQPDKGEILLDDVPLTASLLSTLRHSVGYVPQQADLLSASLRENIVWGQRGVTDDAIIETLQDIKLSGLLERLPNGLDTDLGDLGGKISGGEQHRVTLARALVRRPRLLVLDEPTAALDAETEEAVWQAMHRLKERDAAILIITHRVASLHHADEVVVLRDGRIVAQGPWQELGGEAALRAAG